MDEERFSERANEMNKYGAGRHKAERGGRNRGRKRGQFAVDFRIQEYVFECVQISVCMRASLLSLTEIRRTHTQHRSRQGDLSLLCTNTTRRTVKKKQTRERPPTSSSDANNEGNEDIP